jgi:subtilisin family serine protease
VVQTGATWGLSRLDQETLPIDGEYGYTSQGEGVYAYIIDTGISQGHPDLTDEFGVTRVLSGANALTSPISFADTSDGHGHGTHVAGTVGAKTWGVAKKVMLVPVKVFDSAGGGATTTVIINAIDWAVRDTRVANSKKVLNLSLGGGAQTAMDDAVNRAVAAGVVVVAAAGNSNVDACSTSPARAVSAITVAASSSSDYRASFSNWGSCVDIFAPGVSIQSTSRTLGTAIMSGTSMASPHVAGMAARLLSSPPVQCGITPTPSCIQAQMQADALVGRVMDPMNSPNLLLFRSRFA